MKRRKCALLLSYNGKGYLGMQMLVTIFFIIMNDIVTKNTRQIQLRLKYACQLA